MEYECAIISLIYLTRLVRLSHKSFRLNEDTWRGAVLACMLVANKVWDDFAMFNVDYCCIFHGLTLARVNELELQLLRLLMADLHVTASQFALTHFMVQDLVTKEEIRRVSESVIINQMGSLNSPRQHGRLQRKVVLSRSNSATKSPVDDKGTLPTGYGFRNSSGPVGGAEQTEDSGRLSITISDSNVASMMSDMASQTKTTATGDIERLRAMCAVAETNDSNDIESRCSTSVASSPYGGKRKPPVPLSTPPRAYFPTGSRDRGSQESLPDLTYSHHGVISAPNTPSPKRPQLVISTSMNSQVEDYGVGDGDANSVVSPIRPHLPARGSSSRQSSPPTHLPDDPSVYSGSEYIPLHSSKGTTHHDVMSCTPHAVKWGKNQEGWNMVSSSGNGSSGQCVIGSIARDDNVEERVSCCLPFCVWSGIRQDDAPLSVQKRKSKQTVIPINMAVFSPSSLLRRSWEERQRHKQDVKMRQRDTVGDI